MKEVKIYPNEGKLGEVVDDDQMQSVAFKHRLNDERMAKAMDACEKAYEIVTGNKPDAGEDTWHWYILETFNANMRLSVTKLKGGKGE